MLSMQETSNSTQLCGRCGARGTSRMQAIAPVLTEAIVHQKVKSVSITGDGELALWVLNVLKACYGYSIEVACMVGARSGNLHACSHGDWGLTTVQEYNTRERRMLGQNSRVPRNEAEKKVCQTLAAIKPVAESAHL